MPSQEIVSVELGGSAFSAWKSMSVSANAKSPERTFTLTCAREQRALAFASPSFKPGSECSVKSNVDLLLAGFVTKTNIKLGPTTHPVSVTGRSKGSDVIKSDVDHDTHQWRKRTIVEIANEIGAGVTFDTDETVKQIKVTRANVGQNAFAFLDNLARREGLFMVAQPDGTVRFTKHGKDRHAGSIIEGVNFWEGEATFSDEGRFANYKVKGHQATGSGLATFSFEEKSTDAGARSGAVKVITPRTSLDREEARANANNMADHRYGEGVSLQVTLQGFRDEAGAVWMPGRLVWCEVPSIDLKEDLAIESLTFEQDTKSSTRLSLVHPSALGAKGKTSRSKSPSAGLPAYEPSGGFGNAGFGGRE